MKGVVDRIEGNIAIIVLDDEAIVEVNIEHFDKGVKEGDVVYKGCHRWEVDYNETKKRKDIANKYLDLYEE